MAATKKKMIGVDLGGTNVRAGLVAQDKLQTLIARPIRNQGTEKEVFADLCTAIDAAGVGKAHGIGIGVPSLVDKRSGVIGDTTNIPSWKSVPLKKKLEKKYGLPVEIDNDANCFTLGEKQFGHGKKSENFVGLILGTGLGAGIISRGKLHSGVQCGAGEFGTIPYLDSVTEAYASGQFFRRFGREGAEVHQSALQGNADALKLWDQYGKHLGFVFKTILYSLAPEMIILGGSVSQAYPLFRGSLENSLSDFAYAGVTKSLKIKVSTKKNIAVLGAASLVLDARL